MRAAGVSYDKIFVKEQKQLLAQIKSESINRNRDNFNAKLERVDSVGEKLPFEENHFQATKTSRLSPTQSLSLTQKGNSQPLDTECDQGMSNADETQMVEMMRVSTEQHGE